jgi:hypothetical protein
MKKTKFMATIIQRTGWCVRRVYEDEARCQYVRINGDWYGIEFLKTHGRKLEIWQD